MKLKKYEVIIDDGKSIFKTFIPASSKAELRHMWGGNGEFIRIREAPEYLPSASIVRDALERSGFGVAECELVYRILSNYVEGTE